jgi:PIN domain nuclease of toxin-antitoxin system
VLLVGKKKINIVADFAEWVHGSFDDLQIQEAPFTFAVTHELRYTQLPHKDLATVLSSPPGFTT